MPRRPRLHPLPDSIVEPMLRALATIRGQRERLTLRRTKNRRPPVFDPAFDYDVYWTGGLFGGDHVGRIWMHDYERESQPKLWHWARTLSGGAIQMSGDADSLEAAMADMRAAWDAADRDARKA